MEYFDLVVVVNKASSAQTINVYKKIDGQVQEILASRVSTGVEEYTCHYPVDKMTGYVSSRAIYTQTLAGYYTVANVDIDHYSGAYDDAHMPFAVFMYDPTGAATGIATHVAPGGTEALIGHRESARLYAPKRARRAICVQGSLCRPVGDPKLNTADLHARCKRDMDSYCMQNPDAQARDRYYVRWLRANITQVSYTTAQMIPLLDRSGNYEKDADNQIKMRLGYKTLYIIENVETGAPITQVYRGTQKGVAVYRTAQRSPVQCRSEQAINSGGWNDGYDQRQYREDWRGPWGGGFWRPWR